MEELLDSFSDDCESNLDDFRRHYDPYTYIYDESNSPEEHLIFLIHGVGQNSDGLGNTVQNKIKKCIEFLVPKKESFTNSVHIRMIDWKSSIFDDIKDNIEYLLENDVKTKDVKKMLTKSHDFLYYSEKEIKKVVLQNIVDQMNEYYISHSRVKRIKVSIIAHSLGSVILYDILEQMDVIAKNKSLTENFNSFAFDDFYKFTDKYDIISKTEDLASLKFFVSNLFNIGSPLSLFLTIKNKSQCNISNFKLVGKFYNILHPYDPIAYRIEPLLRSEKAPCASIPFWDGERNKFFYTLANILTGQVDEQEEESNFTRIDYELKEEISYKFFKLLGNLRSHQEYWNSLDMFSFILDKIR